MAGQSNGASEGFEILCFEPIELSNQYVQGMRNGQGRVRTLNDLRALPPARAGAKAQFKTGLDVESTTRLVQAGSLNQRGQILIVIGEQIHVTTQQLPVHGE